MNIPDREKRRARNIIWNAAREYGFEPPLKVFDPDGRADLYWNSIIGAARRCYGAETVDALFDAIRDVDHEEVYEQLLWLGLENAVYQRETPNRPALPCPAAAVRAPGHRAQRPRSDGGAADSARGDALSPRAGREGAPHAAGAGHARRAGASGPI